MEIQLHTVRLERGQNNQSQIRKGLKLTKSQIRKGSKSKIHDFHSNELVNSVVLNFV